jgi:hypothetical protein
MNARDGRRWWVGAWVAICLVLIALPGAAVEQTLVGRGSVWRYRDGGQVPGAGWSGPGFADAGWASGAAELGYGDGDEATMVSYGGNANAKAITTYFRRTFTVTGAAGFQRLETRLLCDDGAVVYLNGVELRRDNLPAGAIAATTPASAVIGGTAESAFTAIAHGAGGLREGENVLAVEVHQAGATSSDISFDLELVASTSAVGVARGPYLQLGTPTGMVVRWRTDTPSDSRVVYGTQPDALTQTASAALVTTEHVVTLAGLAPDHEYFYTVGSSTELLTGGDDGHRFRTVAPPGTTAPLRIWAVGDSGTGGAGPRAVRDAFLDFAAGAPPALWLMLGDNAYNDGTDAEYQRGVFEVYPTLLTSSVLWPTLGNHDGHSADSATQSGPYYDIFALPTAGQAGGVASGTEAYYSFDVGNVHILTLDSYETSRSPSGAMLTWAAADLAASDAEWAIAFWHHPPYSKGSHDSDTDSAMTEMRANALPVLEAGGVDLVLTGHSHAYERSVLLDGHYGLSSSLTGSMVRDAGDGRVEGDGPYAKPAGLTAHGGAVHVVAGSGASVHAGALDHPAMHTSLAVLGSLVVDVVGHTLSVRMLSDTAEVRDAFTITKGTVEPRALAGTLTYYRGGAGVAGAALTGSQTSGAGGAFVVEVPNGAPIGLRPRRSGGTTGAVTALDAAWVLQRVAGLRSFDAMQASACDVTGDGTVSALDATYILQRAVGTIARLPAAALCDSEFVFAPAPSGPLVGRSTPFGFAGGTCHPGAIELEPVVEPASGLDFTAAAFGDCTGNWLP